MNYFSIFVDSHDAKLFLNKFFHDSQYSTISLPLKKKFFSLNEGEVSFQKRCTDLWQRIVDNADYEAYLQWQHDFNNKISIEIEHELTRFSYYNPPDQSQNRPLKKRKVSLEPSVIQIIKSLATHWYKQFMDQYFFHATLSRLKQIDINDYYATFDFNEFESGSDPLSLFILKSGVITLDTLFGCKDIQSRSYYIKESASRETSSLLENIFQKQDDHFTFFISSQVSFINKIQSFVETLLLYVESCDPDFFDEMVETIVEFAKFNVTENDFLYLIQAFFQGLPYDVIASMVENVFINPQFTQFVNNPRVLSYLFHIDRLAYNYDEYVLLLHTVYLTVYSGRVCDNSPALEAFAFRLFQLLEGCKFKKNQYQHEAILGILNFFPVQLYRNLLVKDEFLIFVFQLIEDKNPNFFLISRVFMKKGIDFSFIFKDKNAVCASLFAIAKSRDAVSFRRWGFMIFLLYFSPKNIQYLQCKWNHSVLYYLKNRHRHHLNRQINTESITWYRCFNQLCKFLESPQSFSMFYRILDVWLLKLDSLSYRCLYQRNSFQFSRSRVHRILGALLWSRKKLSIDPIIIDKNNTSRELLGNQVVTQYLGFKDLLKLSFSCRYIQEKVMPFFYHQFFSYRELLRLIENPFYFDNKEFKLGETFKQTLFRV